MATKTLMTVEDLAALPGGGERYELIDGEPRLRPMPNAEHGFLSLALGGELRAYVKPRGLGVALSEASFRIRRDPDQSRIPDVAFVRREVWDAVDRRAPAIDGAPDLVVEVVSPSDTAGEVHARALEWLEAGAQLVWVVQPLVQSVTVYTPGREPRTIGIDGTLEGEDVVPGFSLPVRALFE
jgi:Uma2 family endonuclease